MDYDAPDRGIHGAGVVTGATVAVVVMVKCSRRAYKKVTPYHTFSTIFEPKNKN